MGTKNYTIQYGDTLSQLARDNGTTVDEIMRLNPYITNANRIYSGKNLVLPTKDPEPQVTQPVVQQAQTVVQEKQPELADLSKYYNYEYKPYVAPETQQTQKRVDISQQYQTPNALQQKLEEAKSQAIVKPQQPQQTTAVPTQESAIAYAQNATANAGSDTQALLDQYEKIADQQKLALQNQKQLSADQISRQKEDINQAYNANARQAYINSMLGKKEVQQQLAQAGLNTSGLLGSAYANVENAYGNNLATLQASRDQSINQINRQLNDSNMQYAIEENRLLSEIENAKLELQKYGNQLAYQKYQDAINNYMNFANMDYQKERANVADQQWQQSFDYQANRDKVADAQWAQQFDYNKWADERNFNYQLDRNDIEDQRYAKELAYQQWLNDRNFEYQQNRDAINDALNQYQIDWDKYLNNRNYNYQVGRDAVADSQWQKEFDTQNNQWQQEYELQKKKLASSGSSGSRSSSSSSSGSSGSFSDTPQTQTITTKDVISNLKFVQGPGVEKPVYDSYSGKYYATVQDVLNHYTN